MLRYTTGPFINDAFPIRAPPTYEEPFRNVATANHPNATCGRPEFGDYCITDFQAYDTDEDVINRVPDHQLTFGFYNYPVSFESMFESNRYEHYMSKWDSFL